MFKHTRFDSTGADRERCLHFSNVILDASKTKVNTNLTQVSSKMSTRWPKMAQELPKWLSMPPKWSQDDTRIAQNAPKVEQSSSQCITNRFTNRFKVRDPRSKVQGSGSRVQKRVGGTPKGLQLKLGRVCLSSRLERTRFSRREFKTIFSRIAAKH